MNINLKCRNNYDIFNLLKIARLVFPSATHSMHVVTYNKTLSSNNISSFSTKRKLLGFPKHSNFKDNSNTPCPYVQEH